jgi:hypothetical protein
MDTKEIYTGITKKIMTVKTCQLTVFTEYGGLTGAEIDLFGALVPVESEDVPKSLAMITMALEQGTFTNSGCRFIPRTERV